MTRAKLDLHIHCSRLLAASYDADATGKQCMSRMQDGTLLHQWMPQALFAYNANVGGRATDCDTVACEAWWAALSAWKAR